MKRENVIFFNKALKYHKITKKEFATNAKISYDTIEEWEKNENVPSYIFILLKKIAFSKNPRQHQLKLKAEKNLEITRKLKKEIEVAFWGKDYEIGYILKEVREGNHTFVKPFFENIFHSDILKVLSIWDIEKILPIIEQIFKKQTVLFWRNVIAMYRYGGVEIEKLG